VKLLWAAVAIILVVAACSDDGGAGGTATPSLPASGSPGASGLPTQPPPTGEAGGTDAFLVYREASGDLIAHNLASGERFRRRVDFNSEVVVQLQCTRDGSRIAYLTQVFGEDDRNLEILGEDPTAEPLSLPATIQGMSWSPDGAQMAVSDYDGQALTHSIGILNVESGDVEEISNGEDFAGSISWSPDGESIAYYLQSIEGGTTNIHVIPVSGGEQQTVTPGGQIAWYDPEWAPEGNTLLIAGLQEGNFQLYELDVESGEQRQVTQSDIFKRGARYSPDGTTIAYTGSAIEPQVSLNAGVSLHSFGIFLLASDGSNERAFTADPRENPGADVDPYLDAYFMSWCAPGPWLDDLWTAEQ
jgi:Tol biopolymer transport system component